MNCAYFHLWILRQALTKFNGCKQHKIYRSLTQHHNQISRTNHEYHLAIWCFSQDTTTTWQGLFQTILLHFRLPWRSDVGGTSPWTGEGTIPGMEEVEQRMEQLPREPKPTTTGQGLSGQHRVSGQFPRIPKANK